MRVICMSGSMSEVWKRGHGRTSEAPPDERGGNRYVQPTATAPHLDSTTGQEALPSPGDTLSTAVSGPTDERGGATPSARAAGHVGPSSPAPKDPCGPAAAR